MTGREARSCSSEKWRDIRRVIERDSASLDRSETSYERREEDLSQTAESYPKVLSSYRDRRD